MSSKPEANVASWKRDLVQELQENFEEYSAVGILDISGIPAKQFQQIRDLLRGKAEIKVSRKVLLRIGIEKVSEDFEGLEDLIDHLEGPSALVFTDMDPFKLKKLLDENSTTAPAKPGMAAPEDIVIPEGDTDFDPGPIVGELQGAGINARIQAGKVVVLEDSTVVEEGEPISSEVAGVLSRFDIEPREIGFDLKAAYADGAVFSEDVLSVDEEEELEKLRAASQNALKLSLEVEYPTEKNIAFMVHEAVSNSRNLAWDSKVFNSEIVPNILSEAKSQMMSLASAISSEDSEALDDELIEMLSFESVSEDEVLEEGEAEDEAEDQSEEDKGTEDKKDEEQEKEKNEGGEADLGGLFE